MARPPSEPPQPRRFYKTVAAGPVDEGFGVLLDDRPVRTPGAARLVVPTLALAELVAAEWAGQGESIDLGQMPATRLAFTAVDRIGAAHEQTAFEVARYAAADLLCYFADAPAALLARQEQQWGGVLDWAEAALDLHFVRTVGIVHQAQPDDTLAKVTRLAADLDDFTLAGLALAAGLFGSAVLALALQRGAKDGEAAFDLSRLDETFQEEQWGVDAEAADRTALMRRDAVMLDRWFKALA
jgi:chaperone required for assembly of F1-ATPase